MPIAQRLSKRATSYFVFTFFILSISNITWAADNSNFVLPQPSLDSQTVPVSIDKPISFITYDKTDYSKAQDLPKTLREIANHPIIYKAAKLMPNGDFVVHISKDGHYYIPGDVNGYPVRFMVDSGAASTAIPPRFALNAGIGVAIAKLVNTANGSINIGESPGNTVTIGNTSIVDAEIMVIDKLEGALLGADVLNILNTTYSEGIMTIKALDKIKSNTPSKRLVVHH
ncbi:TIGR02281 family clan AA aspartic protease [Polynucleobacter sp. UK-Gri1-W3]|uniref:retropepsin-like aspartic protease family protein n=1 Tax=Polynucleobacter sp. UK-Gri1-W3 TaxID=1819737 RepID=UPI001C0E2D3C|nr:retropepsin-like aspartic protease [Polynucleobacter sp. UK-Gri1-W3]MBU3539636.1 clan AA aspartic protease [Polynucleobacter sp. UK-Gri1-W3]